MVAVFYVHGIAGAMNRATTNRPRVIRSNAKTMKKSSLYFCLLFLVINFSAAADPVDDFIEIYLKKKNIPGVAVLVVQNGTVQRSKGYGIANLEHKVPVKPQTIFQSGSIGKQFTATAVMMLVEDNKVRLSDSISQYLEVPEKWKGITIRHLLNHTSGLGDYPESFSLKKDYTEEELLAMITTQPLSFSPGEKWSYSNLGYVTLGILIHKVSGQFYGDFLKQHVFDPIGMNSTRIISESDIIPNRAAGYTLVNGELKNQEWVSPSLNSTADGSLYFTIEDLAKWDAALNTEVPLKTSSLQEMWTPVILNDGTTQQYGYGWGLGKTKSGKKIVEHGGAWQGFTSHIARYVDDGMTVATLCNLSGCDATYIAHKVAGFHNTDLAPPQHSAIQLPAATLNSYEGNYKLEERMTLKVKVSGNRLVAELPSESMELIPYDEKLFFVEDSERTFEFVKDSNGKIIKMILRLPMELVFNRL